MNAESAQSTVAFVRSLNDHPLVIAARLCNEPEDERTNGERISAALKGRRVRPRMVPARKVLAAVEYVHARNYAWGSRREATHKFGVHRSLIDYYLNGRGNMEILRADAVAEQ